MTRGSCLGPKPCRSSATRCTTPASTGRFQDRVPQHVPGSLWLVRRVRIDKQNRSAPVVYFCRGLNEPAFCLHRENKPVFESLHWELVYACHTTQLLQRRMAA